MHPKDIQRYLHTALEQANTKRNGFIKHKTITRPTTCAVQSEELYKLNLLLQEQFPTIYELIGGIEGLLMCADKGSRRLSEITNDREKFYDSLTGEAYHTLDAIAEAECLNSGNDIISAELNKEFLSWEFNTALLKITDVYRRILTDDMRPVLQKQTDEVTVAWIMESPIRGVYFFQIDPD